MPLTEIRLRCPSCGWDWFEAWNDTEAWWGLPDKTAGATVAKQAHCPKCGEKPIARLVEREREAS